MSTDEPGRDDPVTHRPLVTIATINGAGGSVVGPRVAERLGVDFLDRAVLEEVAERRSAG